MSLDVMVKEISFGASDKERKIKNPFGAQNSCGQGETAGHMVTPSTRFEVMEMVDQAQQKKIIEVNHKCDGHEE